MKPKFDHKVKRPHGPWIPAAATDVSKTFERVRRQMAINKAKAPTPIRRAA